MNGNNDYNQNYQEIKKQIKKLDVGNSLPAPVDLRELAQFQRGRFYRNWRIRFQELGRIGVIAIPNTTFEEWLIWFEQWANALVDDYNKFKELMDDVIAVFEKHLEMLDREVAQIIERLKEIQKEIDHLQDQINNIQNEINNINNQNKEIINRLDRIEKLIYNYPNDPNTPIPRANINDFSSTDDHSFGIFSHDGVNDQDQLFK